MQEIWHYMPTRVLRKYFLGIYKKVIGQKNWRDFFPPFLEAKADFGGR